MKPELKRKIVNLTNWLMLLIVAAVGVWFYAFVLIMTFNLKVFTERTTGFFSFFIMAALAIMGSAAILNIGLNLSILAENRKPASPAKNKKPVKKKFLATAAAFLFLIPAFLFLGDTLSRKKLEKWFVSEAVQLVRRYDRTIVKIGSYLQSPGEIARIPGLLQFLSEHKAEYPDIQLILPAQVDGQQVFLKISRYSDAKSLKQPLFNNSFFQCDEETSSYLASALAGKRSDALFRKKKEDVYVFVPVKKKGNRFVLAFIRFQRYGKFGS